MIMRYDFLLMIFQDITLDVVKMGNVFMTSYSHRGHQTTTLDFSLIFTARLYFQLFVCISRKILNLYRLEQSNITFKLRLIQILTYSTKLLIFLELSIKFNPFLVPFLNGSSSEQHLCIILFLFFLSQVVDI